MVTLLNTLESQKGELFSVAHGRRVVFAHCNPEFRIYEKSDSIPVLGAPGGKLKTTRFIVVLCADMDFADSAEAEALKKVERFELTADLICNDGVFERFYFHNLFLEEINAEGEWRFELHVTGEQRKKLSEMAGL